MTSSSSVHSESYIYCILLPFHCQCTSMLLLLSPVPESVVAKVEITRNPAERLYGIFNAFEQFGEPQPLLRSLSRSDDPQSAVRIFDDIIFMEKIWDDAPEIVEQMFVPFYRLDNLHFHRNFLFHLRIKFLKRRRAIWMFWV